MMWHVALEKDGTVVQRGDMPHLGATIQRALAYRSGIYIEHYRLAEVTGQAARATFEKLTRSDELARHFNPARLPR